MKDYKHFAHSATAQIHVPIVGFSNPSLTCATNAGGDVSGAVLKMGVRPPGAGLQGQASNHLMLLRSKGVVVSDEEKAA